MSTTSIFDQDLPRTDANFAPLSDTEVNELTMDDLHNRYSYGKLEDLEGKKIKAYAMSTAKRITTPAAYKDLPTLDEAGMKGFNVSIWHGLYAPKGTPAPVVKALNDALKVALKDPEFIKKEEGLGAVVVSDARVNPADHKKFVASEVAKWGAVIKAAGQYAD